MVTFEVEYCDFVPGRRLERRLTTRVQAGTEDQARQAFFDKARGRVHLHFGGKITRITRIKE